MKTLATVILLSLICFPVFSQEQPDKNQGITTIFGQNKGTNGGYGAFGAGYSIINNLDAIVIGGRAAWIINHSLALGFAGSGFMNDFQYDAVYDEDINLTGGYGGLLIEPIIFPKAPVHLSFPIIGGVGGIAYTRTSHTYNNWDYPGSWIEDTETFLVFEPGVEMELNIVKFFRLAFGVSYRFTTDLQLLNIPPQALEGFTTGITFKFGKF